MFEKKRVNWKAYFGASLTTKIAEAYGRGWSSQTCFNTLKQQLLNQGVHNVVMFDRLKNSVVSRYSEMKHEQNVIKKVRVEK